MIDTQKSLEDKIKEIKESAYSTIFLYIYENKDPKKDLESKYQKTLKNYLRDQNINSDEVDLSFPDAAYMKKVEDDYEESLQDIRKLYASGDLLTASIFNNYDENFGDSNLWSRNFSLEKQNKRLVYSVAKLPMRSSSSYAIFSNGRFFYFSSITPELVADIKRVLTSKGIELGEPEKVDNIRLKRIISYAKSIYEKYLIEESLKDKTAFLKEIFADGNSCLTATEKVNMNPELRNAFALFSDGRLIYSQEQYNDRNIRKNISEFLLGFSKKHIVQREEYVPQDYIAAIYAEAKKNDDYEGVRAAEIRYQKYLENVQNSLPKPSIEEKEKMDIFVRKLLNNNKCLSITDIDNVGEIEKNTFAFFEDGRFIVNQDRHYQASVLNFEVIASKKWPTKKLKKELVPAYYLPEIYARLSETQKTCYDIYMEMLKKKAKNLAKAEDIPHHEALERVAKLNGFNNWKEATLVQEKTAQYKITDFKDKQVYVMFADMEIKELVQKENLSKEQGLFKYLRKKGFSSWEELEACSKAELFKRENENK